MPFSRKFLEGLELEKDVIDAIMAEHGASVTELKETIENNKKEYEDKYSKFEAEKKQLEAKHAELEAKQTELETKSKDNLKAVKRDYAIQRAIAKSNPIDEVGYKAHLDISKIEYDEDKDELTGFEEQDKTIRESYGYLFNEAGAGGAEHGNNGGGGEGATLSLFDAINECL